MTTAYRVKYWKNPWDYKVTKDCEWVFQTVNNNSDWTFEINVDGQTGTITDSSTTLRFRAEGLTKFKATMTPSNPSNYNVAFTLNLVNNNNDPLKTRLNSSFSSATGTTLGIINYTASLAFKDATPTYLETLDKLDQWSSAQYIPKSGNKLNL